MAGPDGSRRPRWRRLLVAVALLAGLPLCAFSGRLVLFSGEFGRLPARAVDEPGWARPFAGPQGKHTLAGAVHIHTPHSKDARAQLEDIVAVARAAGLSFLIVSDHDVAEPLGGQRALVVDGVLLIAATEWSLRDGHLLDLSPIAGAGPFAGAAEALADCRARNGPCIASHPTSERRPWLGPLNGLDGIEVHSAMTSLGDLVQPPFLTAATSIYQLMLNPGMTLFNVGAAQASALARHDGDEALRALPGLCSADLHGLVPIKENLLGYLTLVGRDAAWPASPETAATELRQALLQSTCANALAGWVDGLSITVDDKTVKAHARMRGALGAVRLQLHRDGALRHETTGKSDADIELGEPLSAGAWRADLLVQAPGPFGHRWRSAAVRLHWVSAP